MFAVDIAIQLKYTFVNQDGAIVRGDRGQAIKVCIFTRLLRNAIYRYGKLF